MDELTKLRDFRADTAALDAEELAAGARHLTEQIRGTAPARRRTAAGDLLRFAAATGVRRACLAGLTAAAVTAGVLVALPAGGGRDEPARTLTIADVLDSAAAHAAAAPAKEPSAHQWLFSREYGCMATCGTQEEWYRYDGNQKAFRDPMAKDLRVLVNDFGPRVAPPGVCKIVEDAGARPQETRARLAALPTEPRALLDALRDDPYFAAVSTKIDKLPASSPAAAFDRVVVLLSLTETAPPRTAAALYRALAYIPGVHLLPRPVKDAAGRPGLAVESTRRAAGQDIRSTLILDPKTYAYRGFRVEGGAGNYSSARLGVAVVDHPGQRPGGPVPPPSSITVRPFTIKDPSC
ncbi:CU044_5270 family protein [Actinacidiphila bryophytorum]|uniref:CU044_5270 family protein n=1 Tax=Actinacidiphila bryophytorum TaxID=1436133 RepID=UPI002176AA99|nr:CU044_5270 family protein [Actinacidiphila bryophytorum]UWE12598.1 CU044_5270 family protein [Actinacidiphila bryophytorum]